jgi:hypothetical protein
MHPDIAYQLTTQRHAELMADAAHQRLAKAAKQANAGLSGQHRGTRRWWWALVSSRALPA